MNKRKVKSFDSKQTTRKKSMWTKETKAIEYRQEWVKCKWKCTWKRTVAERWMSWGEEERIRLEEWTIDWGRLGATFKAKGKEGGEWQNGEKCHLSLRIGLLYIRAAPFDSLESSSLLELGALLLFDSPESKPEESSRLVSPVRYFLASSIWAP